MTYLGDFFSFQPLSFQGGGMGRQCEALRVRHMQLEEGGGVFFECTEKRLQQGERSFFETFSKRKKTHDFQQKEGNISFGIGFSFIPKKKRRFALFFKEKDGVFKAPKIGSQLQKLFASGTFSLAPLGCFYLVARFSEILRKNHPNLFPAPNGPNVQVPDLQK